MIHFIQFYSQTTTVCLYHGSQIVYYMYFVTLGYFPHLTKNHYCLLSSSYVLHFFFSGIAIIVDKVMEVCWLHEISLIVNCFSKTITDHRRKICFTFFYMKIFSVDSPLKSSLKKVNNILSYSVSYSLRAIHHLSRLKLFLEQCRACQCKRRRESERERGIVFELQDYFSFSLI